MILGYFVVKLTPFLLLPYAKWTVVSTSGIQQAQDSVGYRKETIKHERQHIFLEAYRSIKGVPSKICIFGSPSHLPLFLLILIFRNYVNSFKTKFACLKLISWWPSAYQTHYHTRNWWKQTNYGNPDRGLYLWWLLRLCCKTKTLWYTTKRTQRASESVR